MSWIECKKHESIYYDSSVHKRCPVCANDVLNIALAIWMLVGRTELKYIRSLHDWIGLALDSIRTTSEPKPEVVSKRDAEYAKMNELVGVINECYDLLSEHKAKNDWEGILSDFLKSKDVFRMSSSGEIKL